MGYRTYTESAWDHGTATSQAWYYVAGIGLVHVVRVGSGGYTVYDCYTPESQRALLTV